MREVGQMIGISEEAAKKRVKRGLERFRVILSHKGVPISISAMVLALSNQPAEAYLLCWERKYSTQSLTVVLCSR
jgi:hypothetical protein